MIIKSPTIKSLVRTLIQNKYLTNKEASILQKEAKKLKKSFEEIIIDHGIIDPESLYKLKSELANIPELNISDVDLDLNLLSILPEALIINTGILPIKKEGRKLIVAMTDPWNEEVKEFLKKRFGVVDIEIKYASLKNIIKLFNENKESKTLSFIKNTKEEAIDSTIKIIDEIIYEAIAQKASDIHIEPQENETIIRYRIDGVLKDKKTFPKEMAPALIARIKVLANLKLDEHRLPQDGRFKLEINKKRYSFRVSIMPIFDGEKAALRILEEEGKNFTLEELGFEANQIEILKKSILKPYGMILATGPTGSGKTTTLYTLLTMLNKREVNIVTIEDPIEYRLIGANQTQVKPEIGLTFANGLRSILRQDPNIIMVGEIRDNETASLAINAALTGHLVLSTLHTNDAAGALPRLLDMKVEAFLIASTINVIIAQRLVRRLCQDIKIPYKLSEDEYNELKKSVNVEVITETLKKFNIIKSDQTLKDITWYRPGSSKDYPDGYNERIGIYEVLEIDEKIKNLIFKGANADEIRNEAKKNGMITIQEDGFIKAALGITSIEEVLRVTKE